MSKLLEIFGRAITVDTADLIWHWFDVMKTDGAENAGSRSGELDEVIDLLGERKLDEAREKLNFHLFENPDCPLGRMAAAAICLHQNAIEEAIEQLQSVYMRQPSNTMALYTLGYCYERLGKEAEAIEFYQDCIKFKSHLQLPRQRMAAVYFKNRRMDNTIAEYEALTAEYPEDIASMVLLGYLYIANHRYEDAISTFNMAIVSHPDNFHDDMQADELNELIDSGEYDRAIENVQWLINSVGEQPDLYVRMADIYSRVGHVADAIVNYENAIRMQPNYLEATIKLGTHYLRSQRASLAAEQFNRAVEINDDIVDAYIGLATAQLFDDEVDAAHSTLSLAAAIQQNSTLLFSETATLHLQATLQDESEAASEGGPVIEIADVIKAHEKQIASRPESADIHYKYAILMLITGDAAKAAQSFERALEINPTHHRARTKLVLCLHETDREALAADILTKVEAISMDMLELHYRTAILYCDRRKFGEALAHLQSAMKENFTEPDAIVNIEVVLENLGLIDRAVATWDRLTETAHYAISARYR
ncbi:MAG: tetratricopeptide repeat protein [Planctomycetes bacterium]|nr:tetratricopeptide repeat protein [Planctomycetota bacterium]